MRPLFLAIRVTQLVVYWRNNDALKVLSSGNSCFFVQKDYTKMMSNHSSKINIIHDGITEILSPAATTTGRVYQTFLISHTMLSMAACLVAWKSMHVTGGSELMLRSQSTRSHKPTDRLAVLSPGHVPRFSQNLFRRSVHGYSYPTLWWGATNRPLHPLTGDDEE